MTSRLFSVILGFALGGLLGLPFAAWRADTVPPAEASQVCRPVAASDIVGQWRGGAASWNRTCDVGMHRDGRFTVSCEGGAYADYDAEGQWSLVDGRLLTHSGPGTLHIDSVLEWGPDQFRLEEPDGAISVWKRVSH